ncbi:hypothetical protein [Streptomyces sp. NPDC093707]|uniref:hypothetical protein n=1 Tax=Streptomyces sp. NPDC093707 TaxID=3154984 RepID=UPI00344F1AED
MFDAGYAAAFSLGRQLCLADAEFRSALLEFRKAARSAARRLATHASVTGRTATSQDLRGRQARDGFDRLLTDAGGSRFRATLQATGVQRTARRGPRTRAQAAPTVDATALRSTLTDAGTLAVLRDAVGDELEPIAAWLARLPLLEMIPFTHLVPDPAMLPVESLRFAYTDPAWVRAAVDGALSVGVGHALDADLNALAAEVAAPPPCALLMRSDLVPHWPKIIMTAFLGERVVEPVRRMVYGHDVLMLLYP